MNSKLIEIYKELENVLNDLYLETEKQIAYMKNNDYENSRGSMEKKSQLLGCVRDLNKKLENINVTKDLLSGNDLQLIREVSSKASSMMMNVRILDDEGGEILKDRLHVQETKISKIKHGKKSIHAYKSGITAHSKFLNRKG